MDVDYDKDNYSHGVSSTYRDKATLVIFNLMLENVELTQVEAIASRYLARGHSTLDTIVAYWYRHKEVYVESGTRGGSSGLQSISFFTSLPYFIMTTIVNRHAEGKTTIIKDIQQIIGDTCGQQMGYWPIYYLIHDKMKLSYGLLKDCTKLSQDPDRLKRIGQFLIKYAFALSLERKNEALVCYMDESYVTTGHHRHYGWYAGAEDRSIRTGTGVGKRLILVHAITTDGLLLQKKKIHQATESSQLN
ncbi:unnamed protein product [Didymodactylos carnosus]|uniref:Uncharacterized protein n=2 Tax=Didymodactylos carnosus TaxID=1234261 RepID=A0A8S2F3S6_9BILA|nr:unnamed protein product [Didymodactylos carnosus]